MAIEMQAVDKSFRRNQVLDGLTLQVKRGSTFAFLGRNAAGKTTAIRMLLGLLGRDDGAIRVLGLDPARRAARPAGPGRLPGRGPDDVRLDAGRADLAFRRAVLSNLGPRFGAALCPRFRVADQDQNQASVEGPECAARPGAGAGPSAGAGDPGRSRRWASIRSCGSSSTAT